MEAQLRSLWGARSWPFAAAVKEPLQRENYTRTMQRLEQCVAVHSCGILCGANGVGKSLLVKALVENLPQKSYRTMVLTHSSLTSSDISRYLCHIHGIVVAQRRSDNIMALRKLWRDSQGLWTVVIFEEAQNLSAAALEELRLLICDRLDTQPPFSLLLVGDGDRSNPDITIVEQENYDENMYILRFTNATVYDAFATLADAAAMSFKISENGIVVLRK